jgi:lipooligosaccharide transport system ATP-binding protein
MLKAETVSRTPIHFSGPYIVEAENLLKRFGDLVAVNQISFQVATGECFGILGPNGAGKTTTIRMVYAFSPMSGGSLKVFGLDISREWRRIKSRIGVCQQENSLDPDLTVLQNLEVFARYFDMPKREAREKAMELLGMMRRLVLARSLINQPDLLVLDEPTTGLDPQSRHQLWARLEELREKGISILLTTHYMEEASRLCDRLIIIDHGLILVEGKPEELIRKHVGRNVIEIDGPTNDLRSFIQSRQFPSEDLGHRLIIYCEDRGELYQRITRDFCKEGCVMRSATLEDVFLKLTGRELRE